MFFCKAAIHRPKGGLMKGSLTGRSILIVEEEPLIVMDITQALEESGAEINNDKHPSARPASRGARQIVGRHPGSFAR